jgi:hypothetical protein
VPPPQDPTSACARCGVVLEKGAPEGSVCEACGILVAQENLATVEVEIPASWASGSPAVTATQRNEVIGDYEILGKLGQGGMGAVYRARQISLDRVVALKVLPSQLEEDETFVARFQREAAVAAELNHPNLVHVYTSGVAEGCYFIAMELVEGENLRQRLKRGEVPMAEALRICLEVARGLQFAWRRAQLIHRDIKPSNIYLAEGGTVKVGDLGLAKSLLSNTTGITHTGTAIGTPHYVSPEQARGDKTIDLRADIYSLGCTLYELLTGATPYQGTDPLTVMMMHINSPPPAIMKVLPQCPVPVGRLVNKMLRKARHERHQTYEELIAAIESVQQQIEQGPAGPSAVVAAWKEIGVADQHGLVARVPAPAPVAKPTTATSLRVPRKSRTGLWLGIAAALLIAGFGAYKLFGPKPDSPVRGRTVAVTTPGPAPAPAAANSVVKASSAPSTAERWEDLLADPEVQAHATRTEGGFAISSAVAAAERGQSRDGAIRCRLVFTPEVASSGFKLVACRTDNASYHAYFNSDRVGGHIEYADLATRRFTPALDEKKTPLPRALLAGETVTAELRVAGEVLTLKINDQTVSEARDPRLERGRWGVGCGPGPVVFQTLEYLDLSAASGAKTPAIAATDATSDLVFGGHRYRFVRSQVSWTEARAMAEKMGAHLATITSAEEHAWFMKTVTPQSVHVWLGGQRKGKDRKADAWEWITGEPWNFTAWARHLDGVMEPANPSPGGPPDPVLEFAYYPTRFDPPGGWNDQKDEPRNHPDAGFLVEWDNLASPTSPPEPWQDMLADPQKTIGVFNQAVVDGEGLHLPPGSEARIKIKGFQRRDGALRARVAFGGPAPALMLRTNEIGGYQFLLETGRALLKLYRRSGGTEELQSLALPAPLKPGEEYELEFRLAGRVLSASFNGQRLAPVTDGTLQEGYFAVGSFQGKSGSAPALIKSLEFLDLDSPEGNAVAPNTPATATKNAPGR